MKNRQNIRKGFLIISLLLTPITLFYLSPYIIVVEALKGVINGSLIVFVCLFLLSLFFGRVFCSWICPGGGLQEICFAAQDKPVKKGYWIKYVIWVPWLTLIIIVFWKAGGILGIHPTAHLENGVSLNDPLSYIIWYSVIGLIITWAFFFGKRSFCHHICWMAPFMVIGTKIRDFFGAPGLRLKPNSSQCVNCKKCNQACPMSLEVQQMVHNDAMEHHEYILCGACIDSCPKKAISYSWLMGKNNNSEISLPKDDN